MREFIKGCFIGFGLSLILWALIIMGFIIKTN